MHCCFFNNWRFLLNNWSSYQTSGMLGRFAGRAIKSERGSIRSRILRIRDFLVFFFDAAFLQNILLLLFNVYWHCFLFTAPLMTAPIYVNLQLNVDTGYFLRTKGFLCLWGRVLVKFNWILVFCLQLLFFWQSDFLV